MISKRPAPKVQFLSMLAVTACAALGCLWAAASAEAGEGYDGVEARIRSAATTIQPGRPIVVDFLLQNTTDKAAVLSVPEVGTEGPATVMGLPLTHVFSGVGFSGLTIRSDFNKTWTDVSEFHPPATAPEVVIGPYGVVGTRLELTKHYPLLRTPGRYRLVWQPYGGMLVSNQLTIEVAPLKQAVILTDDGQMTIKLLYDLAPNHVANFIELARDGFYNQKTFHRIEPGYFIQGGCPNGDGSGIRLDGKKLKAEFSDHPQDRGTVSMARVESDPDSASCQFLIANTRIPEWDGRYTVFGELVGEESLRTLDKLMLTPVDRETGRPVKPLQIRSIRVVDAPTEERPGPSVPNDVESTADR